MDNLLLLRIYLVPLVYYVTLSTRVSRTLKQVVT